MVIEDVPESTATKAQSTSIPSSSATLSSNAGSKPKSNNVGAIAGGVVGGMWSELFHLVYCRLTFASRRGPTWSNSGPCHLPGDET